MVFRDIEPGHYALQTRPQPPWYLASASCGNFDLTRDLLAIAAGTVPARCAWCTGMILLH